MRFLIDDENLDEAEEKKEREIKGLTFLIDEDEPDGESEAGEEEELKEEKSSVITSSSKTVTAAEMKQIEKEADLNGLSYRQMMENAGTSSFNIIMERYPDIEQVMIFAGKGNNGGDGFVVARLAAEHGIKTNVITCDGLPVTEDAAYNYSLLENLPGVELMSFAILERNLVTSREAHADIFTKKTLIVDGITGTGMNGEFRSEDIRQACEVMNEVSCPVVSLDLPSGINADTGEAAKGAVKADLTISFHRMKSAHVSEAAKAYVGEVVVADIGIV